MGRLVALVLLTAAFAPAAVLGALPLVVPVVVVLLGTAVAVAALSPAPARAVVGADHRTARRR